MILDEINKTLYPNNKISDLKDLDKLINDNKELSDEYKFYLISGIQRMFNNPEPRLFSSIGLGKYKEGVQFSKNFLLGIIFFEAGNYRLAEIHFRKMLTADNQIDKAIGHMSLAKILTINSNFKAALSELSLIIEDDLPNQLLAPIKKSKASLWRHLGNNEKAKEDLESALSLDSNNYRYLFSLGYLYHHSPQLGEKSMEHIELAHQYYLKSIKSNSNWGVTHFHLGLINIILGKSLDYLDNLATSISIFSKVQNHHDNINKSLALILLENIDEGIHELKNCIDFLDSEPIICAIKNGNSLIKYNLNIKSNVTKHVEDYIDICRKRKHDLKLSNSFKNITRDNNLNLKSSRIKGFVSFIDVRGFTNWSSNLSNSDHERITFFLDEFYTLVLRSLKDTASFVKFEGDGLMVVSKIYSESQTRINEQIGRIIRGLEDVFLNFKNSKFYKEENLKIGIGAIAGIFNEIVFFDGGTDYVGDVVNSAARICNEARPEGIILCSDRRLINNENLFLVMSTIPYQVSRGDITEITTNLKGINDSDIKCIQININI